MTVTANQPKDVKVDATETGKAVKSWVERVGPSLLNEEMGAVLIMNCRKKVSKWKSVDIRLSVKRQSAGSD